MKKQIIFAAVAALALTACDNKPKAPTAPESYTAIYSEIAPDGSAITFVRDERGRSGAVYRDANGNEIFAPPSMPDEYYSLQESIIRNLQDYATGGAWEGEDEIEDEELYAAGHRYRSACYYGNHPDCDQ